MCAACKLLRVSSANAGVSSHDFFRTSDIEMATPFGGVYLSVFCVCLPYLATKGLLGIGRNACIYVFQGIDASAMK